MSDEDRFSAERYEHFLKEFMPNTNMDWSEVYAKLEDGDAEGAGKALLEIWEYEKDAEQI